MLEGFTFRFSKMVVETATQTYFISGHIDLTPVEFRSHYVDKIEEAIENGGHFVVGDSRGADSLAQLYLASHITDTSRVVVYHLGREPLNNLGCFPTHGGFTNHTEKDSMMTYSSHQDIVYVRRQRYGKQCNQTGTSGTQKNIDRRKEMNMHKRGI